MNLHDRPVLAAPHSEDGAFVVHAPCKIDGCDRIDPKMPRGMCLMHYKRWHRGKLDAPLTSKGSAGMRIKFPFEFRKIDGCWHRRPTGSKEQWEVGSSYAPFLDPDREPDMCKARSLL